MFNYYTNLVWSINKILFLSGIFLIFLTIVQSFVSQIAENRRRRNYGILKNNLDKIFVDGNNACSFLVSKFSSTQLIDIIKNREQVLPEKLDRQFKECLVSEEKIADFENIALKSRNKWQRIEAIICLAYAPTSAGLEILKKALFNKDEDISYFALLTLGHIRNISSARILVDFLGKGIFSGNKIVSLLESFPLEIGDELIRASEDPSPVVRFWAVKLLSRMKPERYLEKIEALTNDINADVRSASCECLGIIGDRACKDFLIAALKDKAWYVRMRAVRALTDVLGQESIPEVVGLVKDAAWLVRESVKRSMARYIEAALPFMEDFLRDAEEDLAKDCIEIFEDSGYLVTLFEGILSEDRFIRTRAQRFVKSLILCKKPFGFESVLAGIAKDKRDIILKIITTFSKD